VVPAISVQVATPAILVEAAEDAVMVESGRAISVPGEGCGAVLFSCPLILWIGVHDSYGGYG
jgi:hypothetical protein